MLDAPYALFLILRIYYKGDIILMERTEGLYNSTFSITDTHTTGQNWRLFRLSCRRGGHCKAKSPGKIDTRLKFHLGAFVKEHGGKRSEAKRRKAGREEDGQGSLWCFGAQAMVEKGNLCFFRQGDKQ